MIYQGHIVDVVSREIFDGSHQICCSMQAPFITMAFMALPVIPNLKLTDRHLMDTLNMKPIPVHE